LTCTPKNTGKAKYEVELKLANMNVQDLFRGNATREVLQIFTERLWRDSTDVYITRIAAPVDVGGRLPVDPRDKEGYA
jgi:hypothetical protein